MSPDRGHPVRVSHWMLRLSVSIPPGRAAPEACTLQAAKKSLRYWSNRTVLKTRDIGGDTAPINMTHRLDHPIGRQA